MAEGIRQEAGREVKAAEKRLIEVLRAISRLSWEQPVQLRLADLIRRIEDGEFLDT